MINHCKYTICEDLSINFQEAGSSMSNPVLYVKEFFPGPEKLPDKTLTTYGSIAPPLSLFTGGTAGTMSVGRLKNRR